MNEWHHHKNIKRAKLTIRDKKTGEIKEIEIDPSKVWSKVEDKPNNWHRKEFNRFTGNIAHPQIIQDINRIGKNIIALHPNGINFISFILTPRPMPLQKGDSKQAEYRKLYRERLDEAIKKNEKNLKKFKGKKLFIYLCFYLRKVKYENTDVHNYHDLIIDAFRPYIGDDKQIISLHLDKKQLSEKYPKEDLDFLENTLVIIVEIKHKNDLLKSLIEE